MTKLLRPSALGAFLALVLLVPASVAFACVGLMTLTVANSTVEPGGTVVVRGGAFGQDAPIDIRLDSPDGPLLATVPKPTSTMTGRFEVPVVIPASTAKGQHLIVAVQDSHHMNTGSPARATIQVGTTAPVIGAAPPVRPVGLVEDDGPSVGSLALIGLGATAVALLLAALAAMAGGSRKARPEPAKA